MKFSGKTVAAIIPCSNNKVLLVKRGTVVFKDYWALPGGRVDCGETVEHAVLREVKEETGLDIAIVSTIGEYLEQGVQDGVDYEYYPTCFLVKPVGGNIKRQKEEITEIKLFDLERLPEKLAFKHSNMIHDYKLMKELLKLDEKIKRCRRCRLYKSRINAVPGEGPPNAKIMILGQAPGRTEDREGRPFVGRAGHFLNTLLNSVELNRRTTYITSPVKCFPPKNRLPKRDEAKACKPYLEKQLKLINPKVIITLGTFAVRILFDENLKISDVHGNIQYRDGVYLFPTFHPAAAIRFPKIKVLMEQDFKKLQTWLKTIQI